MNGDLTLGIVLKTHRTSANTHTATNAAKSNVAQLIKAFPNSSATVGVIHGLLQLLGHEAQQIATLTLARLGH